MTILFILLFGLFCYAQEGIFPIVETCFVSEKSDVKSKCKLCVFNELYTLMLEKDFLGSCSYIFLLVYRWLPIGWLQWEELFAKF